jgi:adenine-specific DNA-methyltransferase
MAFPKDTSLDEPWLMLDGHAAAVLLDPEAANDFIAELDATSGVSQIFIVAATDDDYHDSVRRLKQHTPSYYSVEDDESSMADGLDASLFYYKLHFLDPLKVEVGAELQALLPLLWLMSGFSGSPPQWPNASPYWIDEPARLAILANEAFFVPFAAALRESTDVSHIFLSTDSDEAFMQMRQLLPYDHVIRLFSHYLNFFSSTFAAL